MKKFKEMFLDIETSPKEVLLFGTYNVNLQHNQVKKDTTVMSWAAEINGKMYSESNKGRRDPRDDKQLVKGIHKLLNEVDVVIAHNGDKFDMKQLRNRFIYHDLDSMRKPKTHDTLKIARREFGFTFNKLEYLANYLRLPVRKLTKREFVGQDLWDECLDGNSKAWNEMLKYNIRDVEVLKAVWEKLAPWAGLNYSMFNGGKELCTCGSTEFVNNGLTVSGKSVFQRRRCTRCGNEIKGAKVK